MYNNNNIPQQPKVKATTMHDIINELSVALGVSEVVLVEHFERPIARHICYGSKTIWKIPVSYIKYLTHNGEITIEYFICQHCGKCMVNKESLTVL